MEVKARVAGTASWLAQAAGALDPGGWQVVFAGGAGRTVTSGDGAPVTGTGTVLRAGRRA
jgi:hypothetical protein